MGKAFLYALAARGEAGVTLALEIIGRELAISMALAGVTDVRNIDSRVLWQAERP
jgi:L-lactate dehydrogenase (cytochrome)